MTRDNIMVCIGNFLERHEYVDIAGVQKQIMYDSERSEIVPAEEIKEALFFLVLAGFLEVQEGNDEFNCVYIRFVSPLVKKFLKKEGFYKKYGRND